MATRRQPQEQGCELIIRQFNNGRLNPTHKAFESLGGDARPVVINDLWSGMWNQDGHSLKGSGDTRCKTACPGDSGNEN